MLMWSLVLLDKDFSSPDIRASVEADIVRLKDASRERFPKVDELLGKFISTARDPLLIQLLHYHTSDGTTPVPAGKHTYTLDLGDDSIAVRYFYHYSNKDHKQVTGYQLLVTPTRDIVWGEFPHLAEHLFSIADETRRFAGLSSQE